MTMQEIWVNIKDFPSYDVSNLGRIRNNKRKNTILNQVTKNKYLCVLLNNSERIIEGLNSRKEFRTHRLVAKYFINNPLNKSQVNHINGVKNDNRVENLEWCTAEENQTHCTDNLLRHGQDNKSSKLLDFQILEICDLILIKSFRDIAKLYNVSDACINLIIKGKTWKHITKDIAHIPYNRPNVRAKGEKHVNSKLLEQQVHEIMELLISGISYRKIASKFNICNGHVKEIANGRSWKHIVSQYNFVPLNKKKLNNLKSPYI